MYGMSYNNLKRRDIRICTSHSAHMVLILDGKLEIGAHCTRKEQSLLFNRFKAFVQIDTSQNSNIFSRPFICAMFSVLLTNIIDLSIT